MGEVLRWTRGGIGYSAAPVSVKTFSLVRRWNPQQHPRDRHGRFIKVGARVHIIGVGTGTVVAQNGPARITVERDADHQRRTYPAGYLTVIEKTDAPQRPAPAREGLTDDEYRRHLADLRTRLEKAAGDGLATDLTYTHGRDGHTWTPERTAQHKKIVDDLAAGYAHVPAEGKALLSGGLGGSGKTTVLTKYAGVDTKAYATINPDDIKEVMAERGMIPEVQGVTPLEAATLVHEESSHIANLLAARLYAERKNVLWDITMSRRSSVEKRLQELRDNGYGTIRGVFVDIPVETSVARATARHRRGLERYRRGEGYGGRFVPPEIIRAHASGGTSSANRDVFDSLRHRFDGWEVWDNSVEGGSPRRKLSSADLDDDRVDYLDDVRRSQERARQLIGEIDDEEILPLARRRRLAFARQVCPDVLASYSAPYCLSVILPAA